MFRIGAFKYAEQDVSAMTAAIGNRENRAAWWKRGFRFVATATGLLAAGIGAKASPVAVENSNYRSATAVPETWQVFARQLQGRIEQQLGSDDQRARHFQEYLMRRGEGADAQPLTLVLRAWILADGKLNRVEFDGIDNADAAVDLRTLLIDNNVGAPPPEMLQPLHLRLSLRAKEQPRQGD